LEGWPASGGKAGAFSSILPLRPGERLDREQPRKASETPISKDKPTLPFNREEMARILENAGDARIFILTMRYTRMRISDAQAASYFTFLSRQKATRLLSGPALLSSGALSAGSDEARA
jgi:hypothetical protein